MRKLTTSPTSSQNHSSCDMRAATFALAEHRSVFLTNLGRSTTSQPTWQCSSPDAASSGRFLCRYAELDQLPALLWRDPQSLLTETVRYVELNYLSHLVRFNCPFCKSLSAWSCPAMARKWIIATPKGPGCTSEGANGGRQRSNPGLHAFGCLGSTGLTRKRQFAS